MLLARNYDVLSLTYKTVLPLVYLRLIQRTAALTDLDTDELTKRRYRILKQAFVTLTDDFGISSKFNLAYSPNATAKGEATVHSRQGVVVHHLERLADAMIVENDKGRRAMTFGEMEDLAGSSVKFQKELAVLTDLFQSFEFSTRPVFARVLLAYAAVLHVLLRTYAPVAEFASAKEIGMEFFEGKKLSAHSASKLKPQLSWLGRRRENRVAQTLAKESGVTPLTVKAQTGIEQLLQMTTAGEIIVLGGELFPNGLTVAPFKEIQVDLLRSYVYARLSQADRPWDYVRT